jgi:hypothetical protein
MTMAVSLKTRTAMSPRVIDSIFESPDFRPPSDQGKGFRVTSRMKVVPM